MKPRLDAGIWTSLFVLAAATMAFEVTLTRLYSVAQFYHLAFMIVSIALLGTGASGTALTIFPVLRGGGPHERMGRFAGAAGASIIGAYLIVNWLPFDSFSIAWDRKQILILALHYVVLAAPFFFGGIALASLLHQFSGEAGKIYGANLFGAAAGCLLALAAPSYLGGEVAVALYSGLAGFAALASMMSVKNDGAISKATALSLILIAIGAISARLSGGAAPDLLALRISPYKGLSYALQFPGAQVVQSRWNAFSRVDLVQSAAIHAVPGLSYRYLEALPSMQGLFVDGDDLSPVVVSQREAAFVSYLPNAAAFALRPRGSNLILGPRGGLDVLTALTLSSGRTTAVEVNPLMVQLAPIYADPRVQVHTESERSFMRRMQLTYDVVVLSLSSGYHPVRSGAYSLGEDYRYTVEGFEQALGQLAPDGILIATRWLQDPPSEDMRLFALSVAALEQAGFDPRAQLIAFRGFNMAAVMLKESPFTAEELSTIRGFLDSRAFDLSYALDVRAEETNRYSVLRESQYYETYRRLLEPGSEGEFFAAYSYDVRPPTDDRPFFGHYFKWRQASQIMAEFGRSWQPFGGAGYFVILALLTLAVLLAGGLILLPVAFRRGSRSKGTRRLATLDLLYFGFLGLGFMLVEIPLLQVCILYLEQPAYAAAVVIFSLLLFSGIGSWLSPSLPLRLSLAILAAAVVVAPSLLQLAISNTLGLPLAARMALTSLMLAPIGILMGVPFSGRIRLMGKGTPDRAEAQRESQIPWVWAVNGAASVVASILAALIALTLGFAWVLRFGALCYAGAFTAEAMRLARLRSPAP